MAKTKRRISKKKVTIFIVAIVLIIAAIVLAIFLTHKNKDDDSIKVKSVDTIEGYDYTLNSNATKYYKELFKELKEVLEADDVDQDKYAELVTKMFIADFYNLDNKLNKNDVGGIEFVYENFRGDFEKLASTSIYKNVESDISGKRTQDLPVVAKVSVEKGTNETFEYGDNKDEEAYTANFDIEYENDLGYQTSGKITLIHNGKKLEVAALEETSEN